MITVRNNQVNRKTINIDLCANFSISLQDEQYDELISALEISMAEKIIDADKRINKVNEKLTTTYDFIKEIREVFYDMNPDNIFIMKRDFKEIPIDKLDEVLEKYNDYLGFQ